MNQLTSTYKRKCGNFVNIIGLHRKGPAATDLHGCDLAVSLTDLDFAKVATFQIKVARTNKVVIEHRQLQDAMMSPLPTQIHHILLADATTLDLYVTSVEGIYHNWKTDNQNRPQKTQTLDYVQWTPFHVWIGEWLSCNIGTINEDDYRRTDQHLLNQYRDAQPLYCYMKIKLD